MYTRVAAEAARFATWTRARTTPKPKEELMPEEYRGQWPGGWKEDPTTGHLMFAIRQSGHHQGEEAPVWACPLCRTAQLHTEAEHQKILRLAERT